jgi:hypothetical protein
LSQSQDLTHHNGCSLLKRNAMMIMEAKTKAMKIIARDDYDIDADNDAAFDKNDRFQ